MDIGSEMSYRSLNKYSEVLCGDRVELLRAKDFDVAILSDGMGSGVKANILATLTSKILYTMFANNASIELGVETIARTLPICQVRKIAYSTFSILQIYHNGDAYLAEFDNPDCIFIRDGKILDIPYSYREIEGKRIREYRFKAEQRDLFVLMSDGVEYAGVGELLNFGWTRESLAEYTLKCSKETLSSPRIAAKLSQACDELYNHRPGDDTTVAVIHVVGRKPVNVFTGPPEHKEDDAAVMKDFTESSGMHIVCGGTTAAIAARYLEKTITNNDDGTQDIPPTSNIEGVDLVTEGVLTLNGALTILKDLGGEQPAFELFYRLDENNGAAKLAKAIYEECTDLNLFVGKAHNVANDQLLFDVTVRRNLVEQLKEAAEALGKRVSIQYY